MSKYLGDISAYALAVSQGYAGTEEEYAELMASYATVGQTAVDAKDAAVAAKTAAQTAATTTTNKASEATTAAQTATTKAGEASQSASQASASAQTASTKASEASQSATTASTKASEATTAAGTATTAKNDAVTAKTAAQNAQTAAETAQEAAEDAAESVSASAAQIATNTADISDLKENLETLNSEGTVPTSEQMLSDNYSVDSVPYHFRKTASDNADREELEIVGGSVAWNQQIIGTDSATNWVAWKMSLTSSDGAIVATADEDNVGAMSVRPNVVNVIQGHKYLLDAYLMASEATTRTIFTINETGFTNWIPLVANTWTRVQAVNSANATSTTFRIFADQEGGHAEGFTLKIKNYMLFDLTAMFGSTIADHIYTLEHATAGAGVALFKSLFNKDYYAYDAGSMQSVSGLSEHVTVGKNLFDSSLLKDQAAWNTLDIQLIPNTTYVMSCNVSQAKVNNELPLYFYRTSGSPSDTTIVYENHSVSVTTKDDGLVHIQQRRITGNDSFQNYEWQIERGSTATAYEPYSKHTYALDDSLTLRGIPTLVDGKIKWDGDIYPPSGKVKRRYGIVDLGTLTWEGPTTNNLFGAAYTQVNTIGYTNGSKFPMICTKYVTVKYYAGGTVMEDMDKSIAYAPGSGSRILIKDSAYSDGATLKTALSGVYLVYELATPTTEQADHYVSPQICSPYGTEEFVSTGIVPVGHNTKYPDNLRKKLDNLPWNFASLIAPTESGFKATRNYTTGQLLIVNNVLYKATANIANGGTITPNTNVTATTLAEIIAALS